MRTLGKTLQNLQTVFDRAAIEYHEKKLEKNKKMNPKYYSDVEFIVQQPRPGSFILDLTSISTTTKKIIDRVANVLKASFDDAMGDGIKEANAITNQIHEIKAKLAIGNDLIDKPTEDNDYKDYAEYAIASNFNHILSIIRADSSGKTTFEITLEGTQKTTLTFDREKAEKFGLAITERRLGQPKLYIAKVEEMNNVMLKAKVFNVQTQKKSSLKFVGGADLISVIPYFEKKKLMRFVACPLIQYDAIDNNAGDLVFVKVIEDGLTDR
ncbi:MAG: hypothetical protein Q7T36_00175 [Fluviicoccus sp.]|nr:hypothetical protein [Fluviicoccus sp.]